MTRTIILFLIFTSFANSQTDDTMNFEINFELNLDKIICYDYITKHSTKDIDLSFYLIYSWPVKGNIIEIEKNKYQIEGQFTYLVNGPGAHFYPTLVIMTEPKFKETENCDNDLKVYFIDIEALYSKEKSESFGYLLKENIGRINLYDKAYIKATNKSGKIFFEYSNFFHDILKDGLIYGMDKWHKL